MSSMHFTRKKVVFLVGNDLAVKSARSGGSPGYPAGSLLALVTWSQREDPHWFGARIPKTLQSVEVLRYLPGKAPLYEYYQGAPLTKKLPTGLNVPARIAYISQQKAAVLP